ncbi:plasminogen-like [Gigantopelta aegis]|uniref:plasminogen-like n=1 Tax=Gigantopelta aegis TaxID=1735272 RepID=UPI001B88CAB2|nr:plasminogen-like [Gigantopelta aegis]
MQCSFTPIFRVSLFNQRGRRTKLKINKVLHVQQTMKSCVQVLHVPCCLAILLLVYCSLWMVDSDPTCSREPVRFKRVLCFEDFRARELDVYNVSRNTFSTCVKDCAENQQCRSALFDSRHDTCTFYREKLSNNYSVDGNSITGLKYFMMYYKLDDCDSSPQPECYRVVNGHVVYAGRKMTTESGITCQRFDQQTPHEHSRTNPASYPDASLAAAENFCRDPDGEGFPWCYTMDPDIRFRSCGIPLLKQNKK